MSEEDPREQVKKDRKHPDVERALRQFLRTDTAQAQNPAWDRGYVWNFVWCGEPGRRDLVEKVFKMMEAGMDFATAFETVAYWEDPHRASPTK